MTAILSLLGGLQGYLIAAVVAAAISGGGVWYVTHGLDNAAYATLERDTASAAAASAKADLAALQAFTVKQQSAASAAAAALKTAQVARDSTSHHLTALLNMEGQKDASLAACFAMRLPADVVQSLAH